MAQRIRTTAAHHRGLALLLALVSAIGPFSTDAYLPSFPEIGRTFGVGQLAVQQSLTAYMVPFAAMTLWHGAISDSLGRRRVLIASVALFALASLGCMLSQGILALLVFRAAQGMTAGGGMVVGRAVVRDVLDGDEARRLMARISLVFALAPAVGPVLGGWLHVLFGWRSVFAFLALFSTGMVVLCAVALPETLPKAARRPLRMASIVGGYLRVLSSPPFLALLLALSANFAAVFVYIVSAPRFLLEQLRVGETGFLWLFGPVSAGMMLGTWLSGRAAGRMTHGQTVMRGYFVMAAAAGANLVLCALVRPAVPLSVLPLVVYVLGSSLAMPSLTLMALDLFPSTRGLAASCQAFVQTSGNALIAGVVAPLAWGSAFGLSVAMAAILAVGLLAYLPYERALRSGGA